MEPATYPRLGRRHARSGTKNVVLGELPKTAVGEGVRSSPGKWCIWLSGMWLVSGAGAWGRLGGGGGLALGGDLFAVGGSVVDEVGSDDFLGLGQAGQRHVAFLLDPLIVLFHQDGPDQPDDGFTVWEDPDDVGATSDFSGEPFGGVIRPDLGSYRFRCSSKKLTAHRVIPPGSRPHEEIFARRTLQPHGPEHRRCQRRAAGRECETLPIASAIVFSAPASRGSSRIGSGTVANSPAVSSDQRLLGYQDVHHW